MISLTFGGPLRAQEAATNQRTNEAAGEAGVDDVGSEPGTLDERRQEAERLADEALKDDEPAKKEVTTVLPDASEPPSLLELWFRGGILMIPITFMSFVALVFAVERWLALRRRKVIPPALVQGLAQLSARPEGLDPRQAYRLCQQFPSAASNVIRAVLLKVGRPHSEVEHTVSEASEREAARLYKNVRPITLAVSVTPLLGLLGTVQGMIDCFYRTSVLAPSANKTAVLADGIYVALVTTFGGLVVAIPAAVVAHYFEGRIQTVFRQIDELLLGLLPQLERYEGKMRVTRQGLGGSESDAPRGERSSAERPSAERPSAERSSAERSSAERSSADPQERQPATARK